MNCSLKISFCFRILNPSTPPTVTADQSLMRTKPVEKVSHESKGKFTAGSVENLKTSGKPFHVIIDICYISIYVIEELACDCIGYITLSYCIRYETAL